MFLVRNNLPNSMYVSCIWVYAKCRQKSWKTWHNKIQIYIVTYFLFKLVIHGCVFAKIKTAFYFVNGLGEGDYGHEYTHTIYIHLFHKHFYSLFDDLQMNHLIIMTPFFDCMNARWQKTNRFVWLLIWNYLVFFSHLLGATMIYTCNK